MKRAGVSIELQQSASSVKVMSSKRRGVILSVCEVMRIMMMAAILADLCRECGCVHAFDWGREIFC